jgi:epoxyqueuosine reductase
LLNLLQYEIWRYELPAPANTIPSWLTGWMEAQKIGLWGAADLRAFSTPQDETGHGFPFAIAWASPMDPLIMVSIQNGPNRTYADEYARVNALINKLSGKLAAEIRSKGYRAQPLAASVRTDTVNIRGDFPQKTAATRAGLGWIGRHCQLITRSLGPWVRLGTVFTDLALPCGPPIERSFCGRCTRCVEACPAKALTGAAWYPGIPREEVLDVHACDGWKKERWYQFHKGHVCGICSAVCPHGLKSLRRSPKDFTER